MNDWAVIARMRQGLYRFLGEALLPPRAGMWATLGFAAEHMSGFPLERYAFYRSWDSLADLLTTGEEPSDLGSTYVKLFASGIDATLCPPVESFYRTKAKGGGIAQLLARIEAEYREMGIDRIPGGESPDHVSTQLEIMARLCHREFDARSRDDLDAAHDAMSLEERFLRGHLARWLPTFVARVRRSSSDEFYTRLTTATHAFVIHDADFVRAAVANWAVSR